MLVSIPVGRDEALRSEMKCMVSVVLMRDFKRRLKTRNLRMDAPVGGTLRGSCHCHPVSVSAPHHLVVMWLNS
jgi:hypothetical protein